MRIIAGTWRGRRIEAPKGRATRPTSDRVREATFSALASRLGADLGGATVLDLFAGSGALGLEALSRGARSATLVERDRTALASLRANLASFCPPEAHVVALDAAAAVRHPLPGAPFTLLFLDPPYRMDAAAVADLLARLTSYGALTEGALAVWEHATGTAPMWPEGFSSEPPKRYGGTSVQFAAYRGGAES